MITYVDAHENSFITFMVTSMVYMFTTCVLFRWTAKVPMTIKVCMELLLFCCLVEFKRLQGIWAMVEGSLISDLF